MNFGQIGPELPGDKGFVRPDPISSGKAQDKNVLSTQKQKSSDLAKLFSSMPPQKVLARLMHLYTQADKNPQVSQLLAQYNIAPQSRQALAFSVYMFIKYFFGRRKSFALSAEEENSVLNFIREEYEEDSTLNPLSPEERQLRKQKRRQSHTSKDKVNRTMEFIRKCIDNLEKKKDGLNFQG